MLLLKILLIFLYDILLFFNVLGLFVFNIVIIICKIASSNIFVMMKYIYVLCFYMNILFSPIIFLSIASLQYSVLCRNTCMKFSME